MPRYATVLLVLLSSTATMYAGSPALYLVVHGHSPLESQKPGDVGYGLVHTALFDDEPVIATLTVRGVTERDLSALSRQLEWNVRTLGDMPANAVVTLDEITRDPIPFPRKDVLNVKCTIRGLQPGRYIVNVSWHDGATRVSAEARKLSLYRGDETPLVKTAYLRKLAASQDDGTRNGYVKARSLLEQAAAITNDPNVFEELGDLSAPWASPQETAEYYERARNLARQNIEARFGAQSEWPLSAMRLYDARDQKAATFRSLVQYYTENFSNVRIAVTHRDARQQFEVQRRSDGRIIRTVDIRN